MIRLLILLTCLVPATALAEHASDPQTVDSIFLEHNTQRPGGGDYSNFEAPSAEECARRCAMEKRCRAFDYSLNISRCWLKEGTPVPKPNNNNISGVKPGNIPVRVRRDKGRGIQIEEGVQRSGGGDYYNFETPGAEECARTCAEDSRCRAFDYSRNISRCWLKDGSPIPSPNKNNISGVKN